jgi:hypothetical protein
MLEEWAYAQPYRSEAERAAGFNNWLHTYNHHRGHSTRRQVTRRPRTQPAWTEHLAHGSAGPLPNRGTPGPRTEK